jgi:hypothetical protein
MSVILKVVEGIISKIPHVFWKDFAQSLVYEICTTEYYDDSGQKRYPKVEILNHVKTFLDYVQPNPDDFKEKFQKDLTNIYSIIDSNKKIDDISKPNFLLLLKDYRKLADEYYVTKKNSSTLAWIKDEKLNNFTDIEKDMSETMMYHITLMTVMNSMIKVEQQFYCGN